MKTAQN